MNTTKSAEGDQTLQVLGRSEMSANDPWLTFTLSENKPLCRCVSINWDDSHK
jgi:hypothetical protein